MLVFERALLQIETVTFEGYDSKHFQMKKLFIWLDLGLL